MRTHIIIALCAVAALAAPGAVTGSLTLENGDVPQSVADWSFKSNREAFDFATNTLKKMLEEL